MPNELFNPLDKKNLGKSIAIAILAQPAHQLRHIPKVYGAGVYVIYYKGPFHLYEKVAEKNLLSLAQPIYAGKAVPKGARQGGLGDNVPSGHYLYRRLNEHKKSIMSVSSLNIDDFHCQFLTVDEIWIPLGESLVIENTRPLWNTVVDGFGNHAPGGGRSGQQKSMWDMLHPGRAWANELPDGISIDQIEARIKKELNRT